MMPKSKEGKKLSVCRCGYVSQEQLSSLKEEIKHKSSTIEIIKKETNTLPSADLECPKCGNGKAFYWTMQTRAADEGETKFMKCTRCNHTWRDYG